MMYVLLLLLQVASAAQQLMVLLYVKHEQPYTFEHFKMVNNRFSLVLHTLVLVSCSWQ
jgi:hypothetical protein